MATKDVRAAAEAHGHIWRSVERAKKALGVQAVKLDFPRRLVLALAGPQDPPTPTKTATARIFGGLRRRTARKC